MPLEAYGYYVAGTRKRYGDPLSARLARLIWRYRGHTLPSKVDGVSVWFHDGQLRVRMICRDLFTNDTRCFPPAAPFVVPKIHIRDLV